MNADQRIEVASKLLAAVASFSGNIPSGSTLASHCRKALAAADALLTASEAKPTAPAAGAPGGQRKLYRRTKVTL